MRLTRSRLGLIGLCLIGGLVALTFVRLQSPAMEAMKYRDATVLSYYRYGFVPDSIVFDIWAVDGGNSAAGTIGGLIEFADALSDREFREVVLAYRGQARFILEGRHFKTIGREAAYQNPVYTVRTLPEKLRTPDGRRAYGSWTGGMLGVLSQQMDDVNAFARDWYIRDELMR